MLASCSNETESEDASSAEGAEEVVGGTFNYGYGTQPEVLDPHFTTAGATRDLVRPMYESLVTLNSNYEVVPMLAESYDVSEDGKTITFNLREGVLFHDGEEMKAEDVVASMERWHEIANVLPESAYEVVDPYTVELHLEERNNSALHLIADISQLAGIMPEEIASNAPITGITEYVGTGPYQFEVWHQDQHVQLVRFEEYTGVEDEADGMAGQKNAYVDEIFFHFVPDSQTKVAGLQTGEYDLISYVPYDTYEMLENDDSLIVHTMPSGMEFLVFNKKEGIFSDTKARQAFNMAIDKEPVMKAAFNYEEFYSMEPALMIPDQADWHTRAGEEHFNEYDPDRALELLDEAGYNGEEIVILTTRDYDHHYSVSVVVHQQLQELGNATLNVVDWATLLSLREDPSEFDIFVTASFIYAVPHQYPFFNSDWPGWTDHENYDMYFNQIDQAESQEEALETLAELQQFMYEDMPVMNVGHYSTIDATNDRVEGYEMLSGPILWNVQLAD
ncbi:LOW QUALITY PROTEIN: dipeptide-binding ABC transporter, periplasmic substrate-binding component [Geomicrobium sp. JCM 19055]|nr:LOW QUALITY PROTEIN: dipeptide-binding ABC transporter, periplasmic substrate-binding component [Geomicrobium sp. JCM 19055]